VDATHHRRPGVMSLPSSGHRMRLTPPARNAHAAPLHVQLLLTCAAGERLRLHQRAARRLLRLPLRSHRGAASRDVLPPRRQRCFHAQPRAGKVSAAQGAGTAKGTHVGSKGALRNRALYQHTAPPTPPPRLRPPTLISVDCPPSPQCRHLCSAYLAEDRLLGFEIVAKEGCRWTLQ